MNFVEQEIVVRNASNGDPGADIHITGELFRRIETTVRPCVRMALTGRSARVGQPPQWLSAASNVRAYGFSNRGDDLILSFGVPKLGDAAPKAFDQGLLFEQDVRPEETALDLMGSMIQDVRSQRADSNTYDESMLTVLSRWDGLLQTRVKAVVLPDSRSTKHSQLDSEVIAGAKLLNSRIPQPRQVRVVGRVDMVRYSTRSLGLRLENGDEVRCAVVNEDIQDLKSFGNQDVTVLGKAIYRPSGTVLRLDVEAILNTTVGRDQFSSVPPSTERKQIVERPLQTMRNGVASIFGTWPGDETDQELLEALAEMRG